MQQMTERGESQRSNRGCKEATCHTLHHLFFVRFVCDTDKLEKKGLSAAHSIFVLLRHTCETQTGEKSYP